MDRADYWLPDRLASQAGCLIGRQAGGQQKKLARQQPEKMVFLWLLAATAG